LLTGGNESLGFDSSSLRCTMPQWFVVSDPVLFGVSTQMLSVLTAVRLSQQTLKRVRRVLTAGTCGYWRTPSAVAALALAGTVGRRVKFASVLAGARTIRACQTSVVESFNTIGV
jgi:hypothetical protein